LRKTSIVMVMGVLFSSCQAATQAKKTSVEQSSDQSADQSANQYASQSADQQSSPRAEQSRPLLLSCNVEEDNGISKRKSRYVIQADLTKTSLNVWDFKDGMFVSPCQSSGYQCSLDADNSRIREIGLYNGSVARSVVINRKTGEISANSWTQNPLSMIPIYSGSCQKTDEKLVESAPKF
jgi:hypothetical protein